MFNALRTLTGRVLKNVLSSPVTLPVVPIAIDPSLLGSRMHVRLGDHPGAIIFIAKDGSRNNFSGTRQQIVRTLRQHGYRVIGRKHARARTIAEGRNFNQPFDGSWD